MSIQKINEIKKFVCSKYVEREEIVDAVFLSIIARQHCLLIGPPGTGKSAIISEISKFITGLNYFQWLLSRFSTPEELFGPLSLKDLEQGVYKRVTTKKMPEAHLVFLDEIFKANSAILNSLLTLINERLFYNNGKPEKAPLYSVIGASNELPEEGEGLEALFDRFLLRFEVDYIGEDSNFISMLKGSQSKNKPEPLTLDEIENLQMFSECIYVPEEVLETLLKIRRTLKDEGVRPSDRRFRQAISLLQSKALLENRQQVIIEDILILKDGLWETIDQRNVVYDVVKDNAQDKLKARLEQIQKEARDIYESVKKSGEPEAAVEGTQKLKSLLKELHTLTNDYSSRSGEIQKVSEIIEEAQKQIATALLGV
ncbi:AAA family ATPase [Calidifontibacillus erzurumensis]|uniref:AAA family ATPase n=1 Tax=Calidifontibacillus erzurumensis TaxID=2741433 RepID=UPI0035B55F2F